MHSQLSETVEKDYITLDQPDIMLNQLQIKQIASTLSLPSGN